MVKDMQIQKLTEKCAQLEIALDLAKVNTEKFRRAVDLHIMDRAIHPSISTEN